MRCDPALEGLPACEVDRPGHRPGGGLNNGPKRYPWDELLKNFY